MSGAASSPADKSWHEHLERFVKLAAQFLAITAFLGLPATICQFNRLGLPTELLTYDRTLRAGIFPFVAILLLAIIYYYLIQSKVVSAIVLIPLFIIIYLTAFILVEKFWTGSNFMHDDACVACVFGIKIGGAEIGKLRNYAIAWGFVWLIFGLVLVSAASIDKLFRGKFFEKLLEKVKNPRAKKPLNSSKEFLDSHGRHIPIIYSALILIYRSVAFISLYVIFLASYSLSIYPQLPSFLGGGKPQSASIWINTSGSLRDLPRKLPKANCARDGDGTETQWRCTSAFLVDASGETWILTDSDTPGGKGLAIRKDQIIALSIGEDRGEDIEKIKGELEAARRELRAMAAEAKEMREQVARATSEAEALRKTTAVLRRQVQDTQAELKTRQAYVQELEDNVQELKGDRSEFFGRLRRILGNQPEVRVVGDRFMLQSEVLFPDGRAELTEPEKKEVSSLARVLQEISRRIPQDIPWVIQVDGHADHRLIHGGGRFASNWELSAARAIVVARHLIDQGIPAKRMAVAGFADHQPIEERREALDRNRRIELKLTVR